MTRRAYLGFEFEYGNNAYGVAVWATGREAWRRRVEVLRDAGRQLRTFDPEKTGAGRA